MKPAVNPRSIPTPRPSPAAIRPTWNERGAPVTMTASMSRPLLSVPSGCAGSGALNWLSWTQTGGRFSGEEATNASFSGQKRVPIKPIISTATTMINPLTNFVLSHGESQRLSPAGATSDSGTTIVAISVVGN